MKNSKITIIGEITKINFKNSVGWSVFSISSQEIGCTGTLPCMVDIGSEVTCIGEIKLGKFGKQLVCENIIPSPPSIDTEKGVNKLLQRLPGIGPKRAQLSIDKYGHEEAWKLASTDPEKIGVKPYQKENAIAIAGTLLESYNATVFMLGIGLTDHQAGLIYSIYRHDTIRIISEEPYQLTEIDGFGFITVDKIALKAGVSVGNIARINACILYVLDDSASNGGNIWHNGYGLVDIVLETLTETAIKAEVSLQGAPDKETVRRQVHFLGAEGKVSVIKGRVFSKSLLEAEVAIFDFISGGAGSGAGSGDGC